MAAQCPVKNELLGPGPVPNVGRHRYPKNLLSPLSLMALSRWVRDQLDLVTKRYLLTRLQACAAFPVAASQVVSEDVKPCWPLRGTRRLSISTEWMLCTVLTLPGWRSKGRVKPFWSNATFVTSPSFNSGCILKGAVRASWKADRVAALRSVESSRDLISGAAGPSPAPSAACVGGAKSQVHGCSQAVLATAWALLWVPAWWSLPAHGECCALTGSSWVTKTRQRTQTHASHQRPPVGRRTALQPARSSIPNQQACLSLWAPTCCFAFFRRGRGEWERVPHTQLGRPAFPRWADPSHGSPWHPALPPPTQMVSASPCQASKIFPMCSSPSFSSPGSTLWPFSINLSFVPPRHLCSAWLGHHVSAASALLPCGWRSPRPPPSPPRIIPTVLRGIKREVEKPSDLAWNFSLLRIFCLYYPADKSASSCLSVPGMGTACSSPRR